MSGIINYETLDTGRVIAAPVNYGYSKTLQLFYSMVALVGNNIITSIVVPQDYIWIVEHISVLNNNHSVKIQVQIREDATAFGMVIIDQTPAVATYYCDKPQATMRVNEYIRAYYLGCTAGDVLQLGIHGRMIKTGLYL